MRVGRWRDPGQCAEKLLVIAPERNGEILQLQGTDVGARFAGSVLNSGASPVTVTDCSVLPTSSFTSVRVILLASTGRSCRSKVLKPAAATLMVYVPA